MITLFTIYSLDPRSLTIFLGELLDIEFDLDANILHLENIDIKIETGKSSKTKIGLKSLVSLNELKQRFFFITYKYKLNVSSVINKNHFIVTDPDFNQWDFLCD